MEGALHFATLSDNKTLPIVKIMFVNYLYNLNAHMIMRLRSLGQRACNQVAAAISEYLKIGLCVLRPVRLRLLQAAINPR